MALIRARKDELQQVHFAKQQAAFNTLLMTANSTGIANKQRELPKPSMKGNAAIQKDIIAAEKGWIKLSSRLETHNYHLRSKQAIACAAFQVNVSLSIQFYGGCRFFVVLFMVTCNILQAKITPKSLRVRNYNDQSLKHGETVVASTSVLDDGLKSNPLLNSGLKSPANTIHDSFLKFKQRLKYASDKWLQSKVPKDRPTIAV